MIKAVLFDYDGVMTLHETGSYSICAYVSEKCGVDYDRFSRVYRSFNADLLTGRVTHEMIWDDICRLLEKKIDIGLLRESFAAAPLNEPMYAFVRRIKRNYKTALVTDNKSDRIQSAVRLQRLDAVFDVVSISSEIGSGKESEAIFLKTVEILGVECGESVFIDNQEKNLAVPRRLGMHALYFDFVKNDIRGLERELSSLGIMLPHIPEERNLMHKSIKKTKKRFDAELHTDAYRKIHSDSEHLENLLGMLEIEDGSRYLDLGTGNGYLAFEMARRYGNTFVAGLDIAENSTAKNRELAAAEGLSNIDFKSYNGLRLPYDDGIFKGIVTRYALHHFPDIEKSIGEISRVMEPGGFFLLSDPVTFEQDGGGFIDTFQNLKNDGHVHFYYDGEITALIENHGFTREAGFYSTVRYPRRLDQRYDDLLNSAADGLLKLYDVQVTGDQVFITVRVLNALFRKNGGGPENI